MAGIAFENYHPGLADGTVVINRVNTSMVPTASGHIRINGDTLQYWAATSGVIASIASLAAAQNFTNTCTFSATGKNAVAISGAPVATATISLVQVGPTIAGGNAAANGGTYIGGNAPAAGAGSAADWINLQANGTKVFGVTSAGNTTVAGTLNVTGHATLEGVTSTGAQGTGAIVFATSPTLTTPNVGVATATTVNKVTITAPATGSTLTIADGKTLTANNTVTLAAGADAQTFTFPASTTTVAGLGTAQSFTSTQTFNAASGASIAVTGVTNGAVNLGQATVTQITSINTGVALNGSSGTVTTFNATTAAATWETGFTVTNTSVAAASVVVATVSDYSGTLATNGVPHVIVDTVAAGSFHIRVGNLHSANALSGTIKIRFVVL